MLGGERIADRVLTALRGATSEQLVVANDRMEPLCAWYAARALEPCLALLAAGSRRAGALFETLPGASTLAGAALARFGDQARLFTSVDSPAKLVELGGDLSSADA